MRPLPVLGLTMGDPAGIGPELCVAAMQSPAVLAECVPVLFGDAGVLKRLGKAGFALPKCRVLSLPDWVRASVQEPLIVDCQAIKPASLRIGEISAHSGRAAFMFLKEAIGAALRGQVAGVVTAPIHKRALRLAGVPYPGHTEILSALTGASRTCMMLHSEALTVSMVTTHIGYAEVSRTLSVRRVHDVIELTAEAMKRLLRRDPRLGVCGLNPHAGEQGLFGHSEEQRFIVPAVAQARRKGIAVEGPLAPDAAFTSGQRRRFDALVTLYHDQGHIPFKMLAFETGVNITLGLPIIRTSVDHGTAFDIAWKGAADPQSLFAALRVATQLANGNHDWGNCR